MIKKSHISACIPRCLDHGLMTTSHSNNISISTCISIPQSDIFALYVLLVIFISKIIFILSKCRDKVDVHTVQLTN
jgi:hypothetical protein